MTVPRLRRVRLRNYRSIEICDVDLPAPLTFLVGPNSSGKSNFLDALRLVSDALRTSSLDEALTSRGGVGEVAARSHAAEGTVRMLYDLSLAEGSAEYSIELSLGPGAAATIDEVCGVVSYDSAVRHYFEASEDTVISSEPVLAPPGPGSLYLTRASNLTAFRPVFEALSRMTIYDFNVESIKAPQGPDPGNRLYGDGSNLASVFKRMKRDRPDLADIVVDYLSIVSPGVTDVTTLEVGSYQTLSFTQQRGTFPGRSVSDGTLRALAVLTAVYQPGSDIVGIEEPETGVHPAAAGILREALVDASSGRQIILTSHSPDLLDDPDLPSESIIAVRASDDATGPDGVTRLGPLNRAGQMALREHLFTAGELLRLDQLAPDQDLRAQADG
jgi:predicted ATPase